MSTVFGTGLAAADSVGWRYLQVIRPGGIRAWLHQRVADCFYVADAVDEHVQHVLFASDDRSGLHERHIGQKVRVAFVLLVQVNPTTELCLDLGSRKTHSCIIDIETLQGSYRAP